MKQILIASTSTVHGSAYLEYLLKALEVHFKNTDSILFIPYARPGGISEQEYTGIVKTAFSKINKKVKGLQEFEDPKTAIKNAKGIFTGGGNTFVLISQLYTKNIMAELKIAIESGTPYLGTSAGSNICGLSIGTSNDMPIVYPPSFKTLGLLPFNINPHYLDPDPSSTHMGETREMRIQEFHHYNPQPVIGLREGSYLEVKGSKITLRGPLKARVFEKNKKPYEIAPTSDISNLN
jgi:dipeptidase E|tara:strand:- start:4821 stop:5528 length:708 start_codon:yes stop_codon:yes gene_type:complete